MQRLQPVLVHRKGPILLHNNVRPHIAQPTTNTLKVERTGLRGFASSATFTWPLSLTDYQFFRHLNNFLQGKCFHNQQDAENAFQEFAESWSMNFYATGIYKLISQINKKGLIVMVPILINTDVFEPNYNCKEIQPVNPKGNQSLIFIGRTDAEAETPILWPPDGKNWLTGKDPDAGKDWRREKEMTEGEMVVWHHRLNGHEFE